MFKRACPQGSVLHSLTCHCARFADSLPLNQLRLRTQHSVTHSHFPMIETFVPHCTWQREEQLSSPQPIFSVLMAFLPALSFEAIFFQFRHSNESSFNEHLESLLLMDINKRYCAVQSSVNLANQDLYHWRLLQIGPCYKTSVKQYYFNFACNANLMSVYLLWW